MGKVVHIKKFGHLTGETPTEMHRRVTWKGARCTACTAPAAIRILTFIPVEELKVRAPNVYAGLVHDCASRGEELPVTKLRSSKVSDPKPYLCTSTVFACDHCKATAEKAAAHAPSFAIVEIDRGPDPKGRVVVGAS